MHSNFTHDILQELGIVLHGVSQMMIMITIILSSIFGLQNNVCTLLSFDISLFQKLGKVLYACIRGLALRTKALRGATAPAWLSRFNSHTAEALHMLTVYGFSWPEKFS